MALSRFAEIFNAGDSLNLDISVRALKAGVERTSHNFTTITRDNSLIYQTRLLSQVRQRAADVKLFITALSYHLCVLP